MYQTCRIAIACRAGPRRPAPDLFQLTDGKRDATMLFSGFRKTTYYGRHDIDYFLVWMLLGLFTGATMAEKVRFLRTS